MSIWFRFEPDLRFEIAEHVRNGGVALALEPGAEAGTLYAPRGTIEECLGAIMPGVTKNRLRSRIGSNRRDIGSDDSRLVDPERRGVSLSPTETDRALMLCRRWGAAGSTEPADAEPAGAQSAMDLDGAEGGPHGPGVDVRAAYDDEKPYGGALPSVKGSETSILTAQQMVDTAYRDRDRVYSFIWHRGEKGATDYEIEQGLRLKHQTASARRRELERIGLVRKTDLTRPTDTGNQAGVYVVT